MRWTDEEINMLYSNMSNHEIAQKTGRAVGTVMRMRRYHTGYTKPCPLPNGREMNDDFKRYVDACCVTYGKSLDEILESPITKEYYLSMQKGGCNQ